ncbi:hypothetical protein ACQBAR_00025 [Propionibacteriaceae bacterium Y1685]|uniref:hypothetical protein n=1 Tax=Microlunatus sp. Y1700 TaxID=3418487 RepID=UPI003B77E6A5
MHESATASHVLDFLARRLWSTTGRRVDLAGEHRWLDAPTTTAPTVADGWVTDAASRWGAALVEERDTGLIADLSVFDRPPGSTGRDDLGFSAAALQPAIRDFYQRTAGWRVEVWTEWRPPYGIGGSLISALYGRRVHQLALPVRPLEVSRGMDSRVVRFVGADGASLGSAWLRTLRRTGEFVFSGLYRPIDLPGYAAPMLNVNFPLQHQNLQAYLRPETQPDGSLVLHSGAGRFGDPGTYILITDRGPTVVRVPLHERFTCWTDEEGVLRTDHELKLGRGTALRLHYKLEPRR